MSTGGGDFVEIFLQEASEHLQFLREYSGILLDPYPMPDDIERLHISAHGLSGTSASYGFPQFSEVTAKLAHIFQYAMNAHIPQDAAAPLVEFISEAVAVLESDLLMISTSGAEAADDIATFKEKYPFAFDAAAGKHGKQAGSSQAPGMAQEDGNVETQPAYTDDHAGAALAGIPDLPGDEEVPEEILEFFLPEAEEHLQIVQECLLSLEASPNPEVIHRLFRAMHTIKGSAAQVGLGRIGKVAHRAEDLIGRLRDGELRPSAEIIDICLEAVDVLKKFLYRQWPDETALQSSVKALLARIARLAPEEQEFSEDLVFSEVLGEVPQLGPAQGQAIEAFAEGPVEPSDLNEIQFTPETIQESDGELIAPIRKEPLGVPQSKSVRIALERLERMMNAVGELVINRTRMVGRVAELERLAEVLTFSKGRLSEKIGEFQEKYEFSRLTPFRREAPKKEFGFSFGASFTDRLNDVSSPLDRDDVFSELEMDKYDDFNILSRSLTEISADITEVLTQLDVFVRRVDSDIDEFTKLAHRLQDEITQARMVPIGNLYTRLTRTLRDAAKASGKNAEITLLGAETELDNNIIQQISDPLIHLVRNSVAHGLERPEERYQSGKSDQGNVTVRAYHRGNHIYIEVEDDGRGLNYGKIRQRAIESGLVSVEQAEALSEREVTEFIFHPGFSTAPRKTELAGRGVGLDVVRSNITGLNGEIEVESQPGFGSRFTLKVPLTLIISQALFVRSGKHTFALPLSYVEEIRRLDARDIEEVGGKLMTKVRDCVTEVVRLDQQLGLEQLEPVAGYYRMVIVNVAGRQVGVIVEEVIRKDEIVIKSLGEYMKNVKLFPGATIAPDGSLILLIDVNRLVMGEAMEQRPLAATANVARIFSPGAFALASGAIPEDAIDAVPAEKVIVLADDSISVRKFVGRMLEKAGYRVRLAGDGLEALEIVAQHSCDLIITDLEMPRTNGYELLSHLRQGPEARHIPVMVVTSRAGAKHRDRAIQEGAVEFMVKPVQEDQLIATVKKLIGEARTQFAREAVAAPQ